MSDHDKTAGRRRWPNVTVLSGWVFFNGSTQMGFALSPHWAPGTMRSTGGQGSASYVQYLGLPPAIEEWLRNLFGRGLLESVSIQYAEDRWRIHMSLSLPSSMREKVVDIVNQLRTAANLPLGSDGQRVDTLEAIRAGDPNFSEDDALAYLLSGRVQEAVAEIFASY